MHPEHEHYDHGSGLRANARRLGWVLALVLVYMVAEAVGGWLSNSLALLADAGHMLSDASALGLSLFATWIARRPSTPRHTYGYYRAEILAALVNGAALIAIAVFILLEAVSRMDEPPEVRGSLMFGVAVGGLAVNLAGLRILHGGHMQSLNIRGAWLHVLSDTFGSVGTILAAGAIWAFGWFWADPAVSVLVALLVVYSSWTLLAETTAVLMEWAPGHINVDEVREAMLGVGSVREIHDLHVWTITSGIEALSGHLVVDDTRARRAVLEEVYELLHRRFGVDHITVQIEPEDFHTQERPYR